MKTQYRATSPSARPYSSTLYRPRAPNEATRSGTYSSVLALAAYTSGPKDITSLTAWPMFRSEAIDTLLIWPTDIYRRQLRK